VKLKTVRGLAEAEGILTRIDPLDLSELPESVIQRTYETFGPGTSPQDSVARILSEVRNEGDPAVFRYASLLDDANLQCLEVSPKDFASARGSVSPQLIKSLELAAQRVQDFHESTLPQNWIDYDKGLGELIRPIERVGLYAPGGTAAYPSTVLMTAIPARVAGVAEIVLATPKRGNEPLNPAVLVAAEIADVDVVYQIGGVQAIGALAYGTQTIPKVDKICGPGNIFVAYAKKLVQGQVDIDGIFGPTETIVIADESARPDFCAADLIAQAEHDPLATAILVTNSNALAEAIESELDVQMRNLDRGKTATEALIKQGTVVILDSIEEAIHLANKIAPEHLCLMVTDPWKWVGSVKHAGGLFLGAFSPEVMGDYIAGPSHVMPTGGTARFSSALSVHQFLKTMPVVGLNPTTFSALGDAAVEIAKAEGLGGHSEAIKIRLDHLNNP
jgi:histidinol dehydrogenase